jgi:1,4-dihydroxy-2-naphthoate polyprenyltransferase
VTNTPGPLKRWVLAARPRTLPAAAVPVVVGGLLVRPASLNWLNWALAAFVALTLQIATNYANDYSDGVKGTDEVRVGPFRLTASKLVPAKRVRLGAFAFFFAAAVAGLALSARTSWWLLAIGATAIAAGWFYTGGPKPYGYFGFGELFVLIYFGFVATVGTAYVQNLHVPLRAWPLALATGAMAVAMLEANNLRDIDGDQASGKKTLAARLGRERATWLYLASVGAVVLGVAVSGHFVVAVVALGAYWPAVRLARTSAKGRELLVLLQMSARAQLLIGAVLAVVLAAHARVI